VSDQATALAATHALAFTDTRSWSADEFRSLLGDPSVFLTGNAEAFAIGRVVLDEAEILTLATHPDLRRQGRARVVLEEFTNEAAKCGAVTAFLEVAADNIPAISLYLGAGFTEIARRSGYYRKTDGSTVDAVILRRAI
jgi:ribosomal-protein-alanine N-acetyltransferase